MWNRWLTPNDSRHPKRFLATFFLLVIDGRHKRLNERTTPRMTMKGWLTDWFIAGQPDVRLCDKEMSGFEWVDARSCLQSAFHGEISLPPPQLYELTRISQVWWLGFLQNSPPHRREDTTSNQQLFSDFQTREMTRNSLPVKSNKMTLVRLNFIRSQRFYCQEFEDMHSFAAACRNSPSNG